MGRAGRPQQCEHKATGTNPTHDGGNRHGQTHNCKASHAARSSAPPHRRAPPPAFSPRGPLPPSPRQSRRCSSGRTSTRPREPYHTEARVGRPRRSRSAPTASTRSRCSRPRTLGKETDINQGAALGTVDIIFTGAAFAGAHLQAARRSPTSPSSSATPSTAKLSRRATCSRNSPRATRQDAATSITALTYYGARHVTANKDDQASRRT